MGDFLNSGFSAHPSYPPHTPLHQVATYGTLYRPATAHYPHKSNCIVNCDNCNRQNLLACIGYNDKDLCLRCADDMIDRNRPSPPISFPPVPFPQPYYPPPVVVIDPFPHRPHYPHHPHHRYDRGF